VTSTL